MSNLHFKVLVGQIRFQGIVAPVGQPENQVGELEHGIALHLCQCQQCVQVEHQLLWRLLKIAKR